MKAQWIGGVLLGLFVALVALGGWYTSRADLAVAEDGRRAAVMGAPPEACPYHGYDPRRTSWLSGWLKGRESAPRKDPDKWP